MIDSKEVKRLAKLSKLAFLESEEDVVTKEMTEIIDFIREIENVQLTSEISDAETDFSILREDDVLASFPNEEIVKNAFKKENGYIKVLGENE